MLIQTTGQTIPCPVCKTGVPFDVRQLMQGATFMCPGCSAAISLSDESKETVQKTMNAFTKVQAGLYSSRPNDGQPQ